MTDEPGKLAIIDGQLHMEEPQGKGSWPVIIPSEEVRIFHKEHLITRPTVVENASDVAIFVDTKPPKSFYEIVVSSDKMEVVLKTRFAAGIEYGICDSDYTPKLRVKIQPIKEIPPEPIDLEAVFTELEKCRLKDQLNYPEIRQACHELQNVDLVVLKGHPFSYQWTVKLKDYGRPIQ